MHCETCQTVLPSQAKKTLLCDGEPIEPFQTAAANLFTHNNIEYLAYVNRFSG